MPTIRSVKTMRTYVRHAAIISYKNLTANKSHICTSPGSMDASYGAENSTRSWLRGCKLHQMLCGTKLTKRCCRRSVRDSKEQKCLKVTPVRILWSQKPQAQQGTVMRCFNGSEMACVPYRLQSCTAQLSVGAASHLCAKHFPQLTICVTQKRFFRS